jgi:vitamin B12 transporter
LTLVTGFLSPFFFVVQLAGAPSPADSARAAPSRHIKPDTPLYYFPPLRITAPRPLFPGSRSVLDREQFRERPADHAAEALTVLSGVRVIDAGDGSSKTVSIRGMSPDRTAVLVDGVPQNAAQGGSVDLGMWNLDDIEMIQVSRGAVGAFYGPYAFGGAVNLVSRRERTSNAMLRLTAGTLDRTSIGLRGNLSRNAATVSGTLGYENLSPDLNGLAGQTETMQGATRLGWYPTWAGSLSLSLEGRDDQRNVPGTQAFPTPEAERKDTMGSIAFSAKGIKTGVLPGAIDVSASGWGFDRHYEDPGYALGAIEDTHRNRRAELDASWRLERHLVTTTLRGEAAQDHLESTTDGSHTRRRAAGAGLLDVHAGKWTGSGALRLDAFLGFGPEVTGRAGLTRTLWGPAWSARVGAGTGFRPPTFDDLFWPARATMAGNTDLSPERSWDVDLGVDGRLKQTKLSIAAFRNDVRDLIQWSPGLDGVWRPHNLSHVRLQGLDLDGSTSWNALTFDGSVSRLWAHDVTGNRVTGGKELVGRARWVGSAALAWDPGLFGLRLGVHGNDRTPITPSNTKWLSGYALWDASVIWRFRGNARLVLEGRNLFDKDYQDLRGYSTPGREFLLTFDVSSEGKR